MKKFVMGVLPSLFLCLLPRVVLAQGFFEYGRAVGVVSAKTTGLYPRQDEETEKIEQLSQGDTLSPMVQSAGNNSWYMVKTSKGLVGWVKGSDVREATKK